MQGILPRCVVAWLVGGVVTSVTKFEGGDVLRTEKCKVAKSGMELCLTAIGCMLYKLQTILSRTMWTLSDSVLHCTMDTPPTLRTETDPTSPNPETPRESVHHLVTNALFFHGHPSSLATNIPTICLPTLRCELQK